MAIIDVVRFDGLKSRDWLIYKYPSEELVLGTQLIVQEGQVALFVRGGMVADVFYTGTYTLATDNLPILKSLINLPFGGKTPFSAEIYFINTTVRLDINWGTIDPIQLIDPKYYVKLRIRAFGQMGLRILDATTLFKEVIGGMQKTDIVKFDKIKEYYRGILVIKVKSAIADAIITNEISALEISQTRTLIRLIRFLKIRLLLKSWVMDDMQQKDRLMFMKALLIIKVELQAHLQQVELDLEQPWEWELQ